MMRLIGWAVVWVAGWAAGQGAGVPVRSPAGGAVVQAGKASNPEAARLVEQAAAATVRKNLEEAQRSLDEAKAMQAEQAGLWRGYGLLQMQRGDAAGALADFERELTLHPDATGVYEPMFGAQITLGKRADAEETLRRWTKADARNPAAAVKLVQMLVEDGRAKDAVAFGQAAAEGLAAEALKPEMRLDPATATAVVAQVGAGLQLEVGKAQAAAGMMAESQATLVAVLKVTQDPRVLNDGAYELAERGVELPLAEKSARAAVTGVERSTQRFTLDDAAAVVKQNNDFVASVWDTMAWVLFRAGKLEEAFRYAKAAWMQRQTPTTGEHLGEIAAAKGERALALGVYEATLSESMGVKLTDERVVRMRAKAEALRRAGVAPAKDGLRAMLTFPEGPGAGAQGSGEFLLQLGFGIVQAANATSKANAPGLLGKVVGSRVAGLWPGEGGARLVMKGSLRCKGGCVLVLEDY